MLLTVLAFSFKSRTKCSFATCQLSVFEGYQMLSTCQLSSFEDAQNASKKAHFQVFPAPSFGESLAESVLNLKFSASFEDVLHEILIFKLSAVRLEKVSHRLCLARNNGIVLGKRASKSRSG